MAVNLSPLGGVAAQFFDNNGAPLAGGKLYSYAAGTTTPQITYTTASGGITWSNPIVLNAAGRVSGSGEIWLTNNLTYKFVLNDADNVLIATYDDIAGINGNLNASTITYNPAGTGAVATTVQAKLREIVSALDFLPANPDLTGGTDYTAAIQTAINYANTNGKSLHFPSGTYGVTSITFPNDTTDIYFDSAIIRGLASVATDCIVRLKIQGMNFYGLRVDADFNMNYTCAIWWYDAVANSQYNSLFGVQIFHSRRGMIYGALPGAASAATLQSENSVYGWRTRGVQNPFYGNSVNGFIFFSEPMFVCGDEEWAGSGETFSWVNGRAIENYDGQVSVAGGELQKSGAAGGFAADLYATTFDAGCRFETVAPIKIIGDNVRVRNSYLLGLIANYNYFEVAAAVLGTFKVEGCYLTRPAGSGASSASSIIDASLANAAFGSWLIDCDINEWRWDTIGGNTTFIKGGVAEYINILFQITVADPNIYRFDSLTKANLVENLTNQLGYTTAGWYITRDAGTPTLTVSTSAGPTNYLAKQIQVDATGGGGWSGIAMTADPTSTTTLDATAFRVRPGEIYYAQAWLYEITGDNESLQARFYNLTGTLVGTTASGNIVDHDAGITAAWKNFGGFIVVPATAAWMGVGLYVASSGKAQITDLRVLRAS